MRVRTVAAAVACIGVLCASACGGSVRSCGVGDYEPTGQRGFATPRQALRSVLAVNPSLSQDGWRAASRVASAVEFRSGDDSVDVVERSDGRWVTGGVTICQ
jgi:hypothetical protein